MVRTLKKGYIINYTDGWDKKKQNPTFDPWKFVKENTPKSRPLWKKDWNK
jgi:hypothetical protein|tara:strand:- start:1061 stop:1210 length:150 start_codon:yes stop_codon:yes gene_type:complete